MATTKNAIYKVHNGTDFDTIHFETKASQVKTNSGSDVETSLAEKAKRIFVAPEEFGAIGNDTNDDTSAIQNCIDYAKNNGGYVLFSKNKIYKITGTIYIPVGMTIDFNRCTINCYDGTYNEYAIRINTLTGTTQENPSSNMNTTSIYRCNFYNKTTSGNLKLFYIASFIHFEEIRSNYFYQTMKWNPDYLDYVYLDNIQINAHKGTDYAIYKGSNGDNIFIKSITINRWSDTDSTKILCLQNCLGGKILNSLNGDYYFYACENVKMEENHIEIGSITIENSSIVIDNNYFWKNDTTETIIIKDSEYAGGNGDISRSCTIKNNTFMLKYEKYSYLNNINDVNVYNFDGTLVLENNKRELENVGKSYNRSYQSGISVYARNSVLLIPFFYCVVTRSNIVKNTNIKGLPSNDDGYFFLNQVVNEINNLPYQGSLATYHYAAGVMIDSGRNLAIINSKDVTGTVSDISKALRIRIMNPNLECITRIYKGSASGSYDKYVDVPHIISSNVCDDGVSVNGYKWISRTAGAIDSINKCYSVHYNSDLITAYGLALPTSGTWLKGDRVINVNPILGQPKSWICTVAGTPGTWISEGNL